MHYYRLDLADEFERSSLRRIASLIHGLPPGSALNRDGRMWTQDHELLALIVEQADSRLATLTVMQADKPSRSKVPPPMVMRHPDRQDTTQEKEPVPVASRAKIAALFAGR